MPAAVDILKLSCVVFLVLLFSLLAGIPLDPMLAPDVNPRALPALEGGIYYTSNTHLGFNGLLLTLESPAFP